MDGGGAVGRAELVVEPEHVVLDRARGEEQRGADLGVGQPGADEPQDLALARREADVRRRGRRAARSAPPQASSCTAREQLAGGRVLGDHAAGAGGTGGAQRHVVPARGEQRGRARRWRRSALAHRQAEADVDEREVERPGRQCRLARSRRAQRCHPRDARQQPAQAAAQHLMIVDHQDPYRLDGRARSAVALEPSATSIDPPSLTDAPFLTASARAQPSDRSLRPLNG